MVALFILLSSVAFTIFVNRIATKALILTGLSRDVAEFQARSITTGTGFTTKEAESLVNHPARRRLVMPLMFIQNVGMVTVISTFVLSFVNTGTTGIALQRAAILIGGIGFLIFLAQNDWVEKQLEKMIDWLLERYTELDVVDYQTMLNLHQGYTVSKFQIDEDSWLAGKNLEELDLQSEGVMVLCVENENGDVNCAPRGEDTLSSNDHISVYAKKDSLLELKERLNDEAGEEAHKRAQEKHQQEQETS